MWRYIFGRKRTLRSASSGNVESEDMEPFNSPKASNQRRGTVRRQPPAEILSSEPSELELRRPLSAGDIRLLFEEQISERPPCVRDEDRREPEKEETRREKREERDRQTKERKNQRTNVGLFSRINLMCLNISAVTEIIEVQVPNESRENHSPPREAEETDASEPRTAADLSEGPRYSHMLAANDYACYRRADNRIYPI